MRFPFHGRPAALALLALSACSSVPMNTAPNVDIPRFMGDWYVLAHIPAPAEKDAWNGVESYKLEAGTKDVVETTFKFRPGSFDAPLETMRPTGYVSEADPAVWGMKFYWWQGPFRFEYLVIHVDPEYRETVIGRSARDYVWVMARTPTIPDADWERLTAIVKEAGYDPAKLRRVPQRWGEKPDVSPDERYAPEK
ncbi:MAG: lipocalin family protein [Deltaproteobacteria bacterium]|nr:lipocalin family protein [Deltaproteobacteria bacterium]